MTSKASVAPAVLAHFRTLRDDRTGGLRVFDFVLFLGMPTVTALVVWAVDFRMGDIASLLAALAVFTALLFGLVIFVFQLRVQLRSEGHDQDRPKLALLIDETFANVTYSVIVGLLTTCVGVVAAALATKDQGAPVVLSAVLSGLLLHLILTILMCLKRIHAAYQQLRV
ncbi:hypothetical protein [Mycobacteroides abscessus]|uniref:hypothetical protein n=1 Tax=Mycobacteroides abscessus TaxID=36809 RepID=UPI002106BDCC|nr:hypothetical protein [Mycobacteroides abscessus]